MAMDKNWHEINRPEHEHERQGLAYIRDNLPDDYLHHAWANFEFIDNNGNIYEVDLLLLTPKGFYCIELKNWMGSIEGDDYSWTIDSKAGWMIKDNPRLLTHRKAQRLKTRLVALTRGHHGRALPFLEAMVFLHHHNVRIKLSPHLVKKVHRRDVEGVGGIIEAVTSLGDNAPLVDAVMARSIARGMDKMGVRPRAQRANGAPVTHKNLRDWVLDKLITEEDNFWQEWLAHHARTKKVKRRLRLYPWDGDSGLNRAELQRSVEHGFDVLEGLEHPGILKPTNLYLSEKGPALVYNYEPGEMRLDHYLPWRQNELVKKGLAPRLSLETCLHLARAIIDVLAYAHHNDLVHQSLSPASILIINPEAAEPRIKIANWEAARRKREPGEGLSQTRSSHIERMVDQAALIYRAPEVHENKVDDKPAADIFSLGAVFYYLFTAKPPANSIGELYEKLRRDNHLALWQVVDGARYEIQYLIETATESVPARRASLDELNLSLDLLEDVLTRPENLCETPSTAGIGDILDGGWKVKRKLGSGATSIVYLVEKEGYEMVLKLAAEQAQNKRLEREAAVLGRIKQTYIVACSGTTKVSGHRALLLEHAEMGTLAAHLSTIGRLHLQQLGELGGQLLDAVKYMGSEGVDHRDIKPENIGLTRTARGRLRLLIFDFSLAGTPIEQIGAGTRNYRDPFLGQDKRLTWDRHAERYSTALTLFKMACGTLPDWGEAAPGTSEGPRIDETLFETPLRDGLAAFFRKALSADSDRRYSDTTAMLRAWRSVFDRVERTDHGKPAVLPQAPAKPADLTPQTAVAAVGFSPQALAALAGRDINNLAELVTHPDLSAEKGLGSRIRRELSRGAAIFAKRFPELLPAPAPSQPGAEAHGLDLLVRRLLPARGMTDEHELVLRFLGLDREKEPVPRDPKRFWPGPVDLAREAKLGRVAVENALKSARNRWKKNRDRDRGISRLRDDLAAYLERDGGLATTDDLCATLLIDRGSAHEQPTRGRFALAVLRAACETEGHAKHPRWIERRLPRCLLLIADKDGKAQQRADYIRALARRVDQLAETEPLPGLEYIHDELAKLALPTGLKRADLALSPERLTRLACQCAKRAELSTRGELYPRGMAAERVLALARGALLGGDSIEEQELRHRLEGRFPRAQALPPGHVLAEWLAQQGMPCRRRTHSESGKMEIVFDHGASVSKPLEISPTITSQHETDSRGARIDEFQRRILKEAKGRAFLILCAGSHHDMVRHRLESLGLFRLVDGDSLIITAMKDLAEQEGIPWSTILAADARPNDSTDRGNLMRFVVEPLAENLLDELSRGELPVLLQNAGLFVRYKLVDRVLVRLRDRCGRGHGPPGLFLLLPGDGTGPPVLDGTPLPVLSPAQWVRVPRDWSGHIQPPETQP